MSKILNEVVDAPKKRVLTEVVEPTDENKKIITENKKGQ
jgi:hypothetical protein